MKIGIFGPKAGPHCQALRRCLEQRGAQVLLIDSEGLNRGQPVSYQDGLFSFDGQRLDDVRAWFVRAALSLLPPVFEVDDEFYLFADWYREYMHQRERYSFQMSALMAFAFRGAPVVNPPEHSAPTQLYVFQLAAALANGLQTPRILVTNDAEQVRTFVSQVRNVVYRPASGGGGARVLDDDALARLDSLAASPVVFREWVRGVPVRAILVGDQLAACVKISTPSQDYRSIPTYARGQQVYIPTALDPEVQRRCVQLAQDCGMLYAGIDLVQREDGSYVFVEASATPDYLDIEQKTQIQITDAIANYLLLLANDPERYRQALSRAKRVQSFAHYKLPFRPDRDLP